MRTPGVRLDRALYEMFAEVEQREGCNGVTVHRRALFVYSCCILGPDVAVARCASRLVDAAERAELLELAKTSLVAAARRIYRDID